MRALCTPTHLTERRKSLFEYRTNKTLERLQRKNAKLLKLFAIVGCLLSLADSILNFPNSNR